MPLRSIAQEFIEGTTTRIIEHFFSWVMIVWGASVLTADAMQPDPAGLWGPMLNILPSQVWGSAAMIVGIARVAALVMNGHWHPTPEIRLVGAIWGAMFWIALIYCYHLAIAAGAPDFPMRRTFYVFIAFEFYACYRCGLDMGKRALKLTPVASPHPV